MLLLVCGSRDVVDDKVVYYCLDRLVANESLSQITVMTGGARGADDIANRWGCDRGLTTRVVPALWDVYGKKAGYERNERMLQAGPDLAFGFFQKRQTKGTLDMLQRCKNAGIDTRYVMIK